MGYFSWLITGVALAVAGVLVGMGGRVLALWPAAMFVAGVVLVAIGLFGLTPRPRAANDR